MWREAQKNLYLVIVCSLFLLAGCSAHLSSSTIEDSSATKLTIELPGTESSIDQLNSQGRLINNAQITSLDGNIGLLLEKGTTLKDEFGKPLQLIKGVIDSNVPLMPQNVVIISTLVEIQPQSASLNPSLKLTLRYDPAALPQGISENDAWIASYTGGIWEIMSYKQTDVKAKRITTTIFRFGKYAVLAPTKPIETSSTVSPSALTSIKLKQALENGKPTLAEFGASTCIPCKQMKPILQELAELYKGNLNVVIVEVYEEQALAQKYRIMTIPTQIVFDSSGKEIARHSGLWPIKEIIIQLKKMQIL